MLAKRGIQGMFWKTMVLSIYFAFPKMAYSQFGSFCNPNREDVRCCLESESGKCFLEKYFSYSKLLFLFQLECGPNQVCNTNYFCVCKPGFVPDIGNIGDTCSRGKHVK